MNNSHLSRQNPFRRQSRQSGQSLVEMTLMMTAILLLLSGVLDLGRAYFSYLALQDAAGEGAYYGSVYPARWCNIGGSCAAELQSPSPHNIEYRVKNSAPSGGLIDWSTATVTVSAPGGITPGQTLTVSVQYQFKLLAPFIGSIVGGQFLPLTATSNAKILSPGS